jgi:hypothetical protein
VPVMGTDAGFVESVAQLKAGGEYSFHRYELPDDHPSRRDGLSGSRRESHPPAPTDPGVTISRHRALVILTTRSRARMHSLTVSARPPNSSRKQRFWLIERTHHR